MVGIRITVPVGKNVTVVHTAVPGRQLVVTTCIGPIELTPWLEAIVMKTRKTTKANSQYLLTSLRVKSFMQKSWKIVCYVVDL